MKTAMVTGSRKWHDTKAIFGKLDEFDPGVVIHGGARGADSIAHAWCKSRGRIAIVHFPAWDVYGKGAAFVRNLAMVDRLPNKVFAFPIGASKGTRHTINCANAAGIYVDVTEGS